MSIQTAQDACTELTEWYKARTAAASGKSIKITTSAGTRELQPQDVGEINTVIQQLERRCAAANSNASTRPQGLHSFALANFKNDAQR